MAVILCLVLMSCSSQWDAEAREDFREGCLEGGTLTPSDCGCILGEIEERGYSPDDINDYESGDELEGEMFDIAMRCADSGF